MANKEFTYSEERDSLIKNIGKLDKKNCSDEKIENIEKSLDSLGKNYKDEPENDPLYHVLHLRLLTRDFTDYKKYQEFLASPHTTKLYTSPSSKSNKEDGINLTPKFDLNNLTLKTFDENRKHYFKTLMKKGKGKKALIVWGSILGSLAVTFLVITFVSPSSLSFYNHKIKYDVDGTTYETKVVFNKEYVVDYPKKVGYKFLGLFNGEGENAKQVVGEDGKSLGKYTNMFGDTVLYAKYEIKTFTITIDNSDKDVTVERFKTQSVKYMEPIGDLEFEEGGSVSRIGYELTSYSGNGNNTIAGANGVISDDFKILNEQNYNIPLENNDTTIKIVPNWKGKTYNVTFDVNGGDPLPQEKQTQDVVYGSEVNLVVPTKEGYGLKGWFLEEEGKLPKQISDTSGKVVEWNIPNDVTLKAEWQIGVYTITFENCDTIDSKKYTYQDPIELPTPTRYKYDINPKWKDQDGNIYKIDQSYPMPGKDLILTAEWDSQGWVYITNASEFGEELNKNMNGKYCIVNDISFSNIDWEPIGGTKGSAFFEGELDGDGHTLSDFSRTSPIYSNANNTLYFGLFGRLGGNSNIHDLKIKNLRVCPKSSIDENGGNRYMGILAGESYGKALNIEVINCGIDYRFYAGGRTIIGGLFGMTFSSEIKNCSVSADIIAYKQYLYGGGIVGYSHGGSISNCSFSGNIKLWAGGGFASNGDAFASGIVAITQKNNNVVITNPNSTGYLYPRDYKEISGELIWFTDTRKQDLKWCAEVDW